MSRAVRIGIAAAVVALVVAVAVQAFPSAGFTIWRIAGSGGSCSSAPSCGDGGPATSAKLDLPRHIALDAAGDLYVADTNDNEVRRISPTGTITRFAGTGTGCSAPPSCGDGGPAANAQLTAPTGVAVDAAGDVFIADDADSEIRVVSPSGTISRVAGTGVACSTSPTCGDGSLATSARLNSPNGIAVDTTGDLYIADTGDDEVREVTPGGTISRVAGTGGPCASPPTCGDSGAATSATMTEPSALAFDSSGNLYIADSGDHEVREVTLGGEIARIAGSGAQCTTPPACNDGANATTAKLDDPEALAIDAAGDLYIADSSGNEVRELTPAGAIARVAGTGTACSTAPACGDGGAATNASLAPDGLAIDAAGNVYVTDAFSGEIRWLSGPQAGPPGTNGTDGTNGTNGPPGTNGANGAPAALVVVAFSAKTARTSVVLHYALTAGAPVTLKVTAPGAKAITVAHATGRAGVNTISWNRKLHGKKAKRGRYKLSVSITVNGRTATSSLTVKI